jgi:hypothetical protein
LVRLPGDVFFTNGKTFGRCRVSPALILCVIRFI